MIIVCGMVWCPFSLTQRQEGFSIEKSGWGAAATPTMVSATTFELSGLPILIRRCAECLIKQYLQTYGQGPIYSEMWEEALAGIQKHLVATTKHSNLKSIAGLPQGVDGKLSPKMDHLVCFLPGSIAISATESRTEAEARQLPSWNAKKEEQMKLAKKLMKTCWAMYAVAESGLSPEIAWFEADPSDLEPGPASRPQTRISDDLSSWKKDFIIKPLDAHNLQRTETVESLFLMFRVTNDPIYRKWGRFSTHSKSTCWFPMGRDTRP